MQTCVKKPGLPEEGRALEGAGSVRSTSDYCDSLFFSANTLRVFSMTCTSLSAGDTGNPVCSQKTLTTHEFACVTLQLNTCNGSS